jgi:hypothetical protein
MSMCNLALSREAGSNGRPTRTAFGVRVNPMRVFRRTSARFLQAVARPRDGRRRCVSTFSVVKVPPPTLIAFAPSLRACDGTGEEHRIGLLGISSTNCLGWYRTGRIGSAPATSVPLQVRRANRGICVS